MRYADPYVPVLDPSRRLDQAPHQIQPGNQGLYNGWGPKPTGYYPDMNGETMGRIPSPLDNGVMQPYGSPGSLGLIPTEPGSSYEQIDQHPFLQVAATWTPDPYGNGREDGEVDPLTDGPPRPELWNLSLHYYRRSGNSNSRFADVPDGRQFKAVGSQDGASTTYFVSSSASLAPYNPDPVTGLQAESMYSIAPGPAHGWSSVPVIDTRVQDSKKSKLLKQQQNVNQNRLANSTYAGQTYSQHTAHVRNPAGAPNNVPSWRTRG